VLFDSFVVSYKRFKERFVKVIIGLETTAISFDESGRSRYPLYWTRKPCGFKEWPRLTEGADELEVLSLFDALPMRLPCRRLIGAYAKSVRWAAVRGMGLCFMFCRSIVTLTRSVRLLGDELGFFSSSCFSFDTRSRVNTGWWGYLRRHSDPQVSKAGDQYSGR